jgi:subtilisin family serine protease
MLRFLMIWLMPALAGAQIIPNWYIVELAEGPRATVAARRAAQDRVARAMGTRHRVRSRVQVVANALVVESAAGEELGRMAGVRRVTPVVELRTSLDRAVELHQIRAAWERLPDAGRAGAGIKIGILDTGIDARHPAFLGEGMQAPEGFPKVSSEAFREATNGKVIVQRSYDALNRTAESIVDGAGHGTAVAMVAAGARVRSPYGEMAGAAPGAWLGAYRVFGGVGGTRGSSAALLQALDDAVADGMDVVNMSLGLFPPLREEIDEGGGQRGAGYCFGGFADGGRGGDRCRGDPERPGVCRGGVDCRGREPVRGRFKRGAAAGAGAGQTGGCERDGPFGPGLRPAGGRRFARGGGTDSAGDLPVQ